MSRIKVHFALKDDDWEQYLQRVEQFPDKVKKAVNDYMHDDARNLMIKSIEKRKYLLYSICILK